MRENIALTKAEAFAVRIVDLCRSLSREKRERVMSNQLLRSGTSIGANLAEAECAASRNDFSSKVYIALKECNESRYWLRLLNKTGYLDHDEFHSLYMDCENIYRILQASTKTMNTRGAK